MEIIRLLALTGCRLSEIVALRRQEVDIEASCLRLADTKKGASVRPIGLPVVEFLEQRNAQVSKTYVFPGGGEDTPRLMRSTVAPGRRLWLVSLGRRVTSLTMGRFSLRIWARASATIPPGSSRMASIGFADTRTFTLQTVAGRFPRRLLALAARHARFRHLPVPY